MTTPTPPSDADRIIAAQRAEAERTRTAHREEARRTRVLLVWLLVGIPLAVGAIWWGIALVSAAGRSDSPSNVTSTVETSAPAMVLGITDSTPCAAIDAGVTDMAVTDYAGQPADSVRGAFQNECTDHPDWPAGRALAQAKRDFTAPTP